MFALVIPSYNSARTLPETLDSLLMLEERARIELILTDDASSDTTVAILEQWCREHGEQFGRVVLNVNPVNLGSSANHGKGFSLAQSEYGVYIGADDLITNAFFPREFEEALALQPEVRLARTDIIAHDRPRNLRWRVFGRHGPFFRLSARRQFSLFVVHHNKSLWMCGPGTVVHIATLLGTPGAIDSRCRYIEDSHLYLAMSRAGIAIRYLPVSGILWVRSPASLSYRADTDFRTDEELRVRELIQPNLHKVFPWEWLLGAMLDWPWPLPGIARRLVPFYREFGRGRLFV